MTSLDVLFTQPAYIVSAEINQGADLNRFTVFGVDEAIAFARVLLQNGARSIAIMPDDENDDSLDQLEDWPPQRQEGCGCGCPGCIC